MRDQGCTEEAAGAFLKNHYVARLRLELFLDFERFWVDLYPLPIGRVDVIRFGFLSGFGGRVEDRNFQRTSQGEKFLRRLDRLMGVDAARALVAIDELVGVFTAAFVGEIVQIDGQESRSLADVSVALIGRVGF